MKLKSGAGSPRRWSQLNAQIVGCEQCSRLRAHCRKVAQEKRRAFRDWEYWGKPLPNFGDPQARLLIVGLAPAAHGGNRTGRVFTGDRSGDWLFRALYKAGFANQATAVSIDDGLILIDCAITAVCHCAPPDNKPLSEELAACRPWLQQTIEAMNPRVFLALGQIAWRETIVELARRDWLGHSRPKFGHGVLAPLQGDRWLLASYHPSQQNTFTRRLTETMLDDVFTQANRILGRGETA